MKSHDWIRWLLFLPVAILAYFIVGILYEAINLLANNFLFIPIPRIFIKIISVLAGSYAFVLVGARIAPKAKFAVAITLSIIYFLKSCLTLLITLSLGDKALVSLPEAFIILFAGSGVAFYVSYIFYVESRKE